MTTHAAVLPSEIPETAPAAPPPPHAYFVYTYTTAQELAWLDDLAEHKRLDLLTNLRQAYKVRHWNAPGMMVDQRRVEAHLDKLIGRLQAGRRVRH